MAIGPRVTNVCIRLPVPGAERATLPERVSCAVPAFVYLSEGPRFCYISQRPFALGSKGHPIACTRFLERRAGKANPTQRIGTTSITSTAPRTASAIPADETAYSPQLHLHNPIPSASYPPHRRSIKAGKGRNILAM